MKTVLIQCKDMPDFEKVKHLLPSLNGILKYADYNTYKIECRVDEKVLQYIKRKWTVDITEV